MPVDAVEPDGTATVTQTNDRVKFKVKGPGGTIVYDSADGEESDHPQWQGGLRVVIMAMQHAECTFRVTPGGIVSDVKPTDELVARIKEDPAIASVFTESQLKANAKAVFHPLPGGPLKPGETWEYEDESDDVLPGIKMEYVITKTYEGSEERDGRQVARIGETDEITTEFDQNSPLKYVPDDEANVGLEYYDLALGWKIESHDTSVAAVTQSLGGNTIEVETSTKVAIYLQPAAEEEPVPESNSNEGR
ncbi:MAG: DUF6263 family protein [Planctomycetota bacterium]|nr:DUF6263 family protein [Planctomycetota bacterium]